MPVSRLSKPLLVGESNPYGSDPHFALYPLPEGGSGHRLCRRILGMRCADYLRAFDRANLCAGDWSEAYAKKSARAVLSEIGRVILLGSKVCRAFSASFIPFATTDVAYSPSSVVTALILPHPSGRSRIWNDPTAVARTRAAVVAFCPELAHLIGAVDEDGDQT